MSKIHSDNMGSAYIEFGSKDTKEPSILEYYNDEKEAERRFKKLKKRFPNADVWLERPKPVNYKYTKKNALGIWFPEDTEVDKKGHPTHLFSLEGNPFFSDAEIMNFLITRNAMNIIEGRKER